MVKVNVDLSGVKIPKTVAGVKVPKKLRKKGKKLLAKAQSDEGQRAIAAGLTIAGTVLAAKAARHARPETPAGKEAGAPAKPKPPARPGEPGTDPGRELGDAIAAGIGALQNFLAGRGR